MNCQLITDSTKTYLTRFPESIDLTTIVDPYTQETLFSLCQRAFSTGLPYFTFSIATLENSSITYYDTVSYRLGQYNNISCLKNDPTTRQSIKEVTHFAIENIGKLDQTQELKASSFFLDHYFTLTSKFLDKHQSEQFIKKIEHYLFSALNYHAIGQQDFHQLQILKKIHRVVDLFLKSALMEDNHLSLKSWIQAERNKWTAVSF